MDLSKGKLTSKKFRAWLNSEFDRLGITQYEAIKIQKTGYTEEQYERGKSKLIVTCSDKENPNDNAFFLLDNFLSEYEDYLKEGKSLQCRFEHNRPFLTNLIVEVLSN